MKDVFIRPRPDTDGMTAEEIREAIVEAEENLRIAKELKAAGGEDHTTWFIQEIRGLEAALARRNGQKADSVENIEELAPPEASIGTDDEPGAFPQEAFTGVFYRWLDQMRQVTDAPAEFLWASLLLAAGLIIGRGACISNPIPLYPNFYVLMLGQSGSTRKSTVVYLARHLLDLLNIKIKSFDGLVSSEGLIEGLAAEQGTKALATVDEFRNLLTIANRTGNDLVPRLNSLYYCQNVSVDRRKDPVTAEDPFLSIIAASPVEYLEELICDRDIAGGFYNRFLLIPGTARQPMPRPKKLREVAWHHILKPLNELRGVHGRELNLDPDAAGLWDRWFVAWVEAHRTLSARDRLLTERVPEHVLKTALVYALTKNELNVSAPSLAIAIKIAGWLQESTLHAFRDSGIDKRTKAERIIIRRLRKSPASRMTVRSLQQYCGGFRVTSTDFRDALRVLKDTDQIADCELTELGRPKRAVKLTDPS